MTTTPRQAWPRQRVYVARKWADAWTEVPGLYAETLVWSVNPTLPVATFSYRYGVGALAEETQRSVHRPLELIDWYVKVEFTGLKTLDGEGKETSEKLPNWYGIFTRAERHDDGVVHHGGQAAASGHQKLAAYGLELLLERTPWADAWYWEPDGLGDTPVRRALAFNAEHSFHDGSVAGADRKLLGNRSADTGQRGVYLFAANPKTAEYWSSRDIVDYLLAYHTPTDAHGNQMLAFALWPGHRELVPDWDMPVIAPEGRSANLKQILDALFDRRRALAWHLTVDPEDESTLYLAVCPYTDELVMLPSGAVQQPNPDTLALDLTERADVRRVVVTEDSAHKVERVVCRGAKKRAMFSLGFDRGNLQIDWTHESAAAYHDGPAKPPDTDDTEWADRLEKWRAEEAQERPFAYWRVPPDWDGRVAYGGDHHPVWPFDAEHDLGVEQLDEYGNPDPPLTVYMPLFRLSREVFGGVLVAAPEESAEHAGRPAGWLKVGQRDGHDVWARLDTLQSGDAHQLLEDEPGADFAGSLHVQEHGPGVVLKLSGPGAVQHALCSAEWAQLAPHFEFDVTPRFNWKTDLVLTVAAEYDGHVQGIWPTVGNLPEPQALDDVARILFVDCGDRFRWDWIAAGTVTRTENGALIVEKEGVSHRDDRTYLRDLARFIFEWYGQKRRALEITFSRPTAECWRGHLITEYGGGELALEIRSLVTSVTMDLVQGTTHVLTSWAELDPVRL